MLQLSSIIRRVGFMMLLTLQLSAFSQSNYTFTPSVGTYTSISGTEVTSTLSNYNPINIGFTFMFDGINYTQVVPSRCGWLSFKTGITPEMGNSDDAGNLTNATCRPLIGGLFADNGQPGAFKARYTVTGTSPNRVFIFEWYNIQWHWYTANYLSFEIKLYETSNKIEFIYNPISNLDAYYCCTSIGLAFANAGEFLSLSNFSTSPTASNTSESHNFETQPVSGLTYTFTPIPTKPEPTNQGSNFTSAISADNIILNWTDATGGTLPDGYLILASKTDSFTDPIDGSNITDDNDLSDGNGMVKVLNGVQSFYGWKNAESSTLYYFKIYSYSNSGVLRNYNTTSAPTSSVKLIKTTPLQHATNFFVKNNSGNYVLEWTDAKKFGNSLLFFSENTSHIDCGNGSSLNITGNSITLEAWVKPNVSLNDIFQKENSGLNGGYEMYSNEFGQVCFSLHINGSWNEVKSPINTFVIGSWSHICGTYDGSTQKIFINGNLVASKPTTGNITASTSNLFIGKSNTSTINYYNGQMDEIAIWSTARSQSDILSDMNLQLTGSESGLVAYYKCNQGIAGANNDGLSTLLDATTNANHATLRYFMLMGKSGNYATSNTNSDIDGYLLLVSSTNTFPTVVNGTDITTDIDLADGTGAVKVIQGVQTFSGWTNINQSNTYNFKIVPYSNKGSEIVYNTGGTIPQVSIKPEPTNHVTSFIASGVNGNISLNWTDATGTQIPDGYVIFASTSPSITPPVDGTEIGIDNNLADGAGAVKVLSGVQSFSGWINLTANTTYYFNIYPFTNAGGAINYKTNGTLTQTNGRIVIYAEPTNHVTGFSATNTGTLTLSWTDASGMPSLMSNVLNFDGINDYITCAGSQNPSVFTAEAWYSTSSNADQAIVSTLSEVAGTGFEIHTFQGKPVVTLRNSGTWLDLASTTTLAANTWNHIALVYDGALIKLYVNGQLVNSTSLPSASYIKGTSPLVIGKRSSGLLYFNGSIEEVRMWNIARTQAEIQNNMYNELAGTENGLISYYKFNQGTAGGTNTGVTTLTDATTNAFNGTLSNFALTGTTSNWINPGQAPTGYLIKVSTTNSFTDPVDGTEITTDNDLTDGTAVIKVSQGTQIYSSFAGTKGGTTYYFKIWSYTNSGSYINYKTTVTVPTASIPFTKPRPLTHVTGLTANNNNKTINVSWIDAKAVNMGNAIALDGANDYITVPDGSIDNGGNTAFTIETWVKWTPASASNVQFICGKGLEQMEIHTAGDAGANGLRFIPTTGVYLDAYNVLALNTWTHVAVVYDATNRTYKMYINGVDAPLNKQGPGSIGAALQNTTSAFELGRRPAVSSLYLNGSLDEFRVWNKVRTQAEIAANMFNELSSSETGLLVYYKFNQGVEYSANPGLTLVPDASGAANNGTLTNSALTGSTSNWINFKTDAPDGYLIKASKTNNIIAPNNGSMVTNDNNLSDGVGAVNVLAGIQTFNGWTNFTDTTTYYYKVYPYSNSGTSTIYNTTPTIPWVKDSIGIDRFKEQSTTIPNMGQGNSAWADYDGDGDMDFIISGGQLVDANQNIIPSPSLLYQQNATNNTFSNVATLKGAMDGDINWIDYDNDGDLDAFITGYDGTSRVASIYRQETNHSFTELSSLFTKKVRYSSTAWADYDNDGDIDVFITGQTSSSLYYSALYKNNGNGTFTELPELLFTPVANGSVAWGDYNNDGFQDLLLTGNTGGNSISKIYQNTGDGLFTEQSAINLPGIYSRSASWVDYDNDGKLDISLNGCIYKNNGNNIFEAKFTPSQNSLDLSKCAWGDYNNDGLSDFILMGHEIGGTNDRVLTILYEQNTDHSFTQRADFGFESLSQGSCNLVDFNNDGNLDLFISGSKWVGVNKQVVTKLYKNTNFKKNTPPTKPTGLKHIVGSQYILSWNPSSDAETPSNALTYNLRVGTTKNGCEFTSPMSLSSGYKQTPTIGNCQNNTSTTLNLKVGKKYFWSVQAVDNSFKGSAFSALDSIVIDTIPASKLSIKVLSNTSIKAKWARGNGTRCAVFVKMKFQNATLETSYPANGMQYIGVEKFKTGPTIGLTGWYCVYNGIADSVIVTNLDPSSLYAIHVVEYLDNSGSPKYYRMNSLPHDNYAIFNTNQYLTNYTGFAETNLADFNKDGFVDVLNISGTIATINFNNGDNSFTSLAAFSIPKPAKYSEIDWIKSSCADYNNDGFMDIAIIGNYYNGNPRLDSTFTKLYRNKGDNTFIEETGLNITGVSGGSLTWGDYDNDGDVDLFIVGSYGYYEYEKFLIREQIAQLYINNSTTSNANFTQSSYTDFFGVEEGNAVWADFNNDGYLDIAYSGSVPGASVNTKIGVFKLFINSKNGAFSEIATDINGGYKTDGNTVFFNDYDNDGDLDIKVEGNTASSGNVDNFRILINNFPEPTLSLSNNPVSFFDYNKKVDFDNDGDLDEIDNSIKRNNDNYYPGNFASNRKPATPINLKYVNIPGYVQLMWDNVISDETKSSQISYNIRLRKEGSSQWLGAPQSRDNGIRLTPNFGNIPFRPNGFNNFARYNLPEGNYEWQIQAVDGAFSGSEWSEIKQFTVKAALASFTAEPVCLGDTTVFIDNSFSFVGIKEWRWDFGDIPIVTGKEQKHVFQTTGDHTVRLIITNNNLQNDTVYGVAHVKPIPSVSFTADDVCEGLTATIINPANTNGLIDWIWDFGDGNTSNYFNPGTHTYAEKKNYTIKFKVTGENNCSNTATKTITIKERPAKPKISVSINDFCPNTLVELKVTTDTTNLNFQWKRNGEFIPTAKHPIYADKLDQADYSVVVEPGSCSSESDKLPITTKPAPTKPNILGHGPTIWTLACDNMTATSYKWFYNNTDLPIPGANGYQYYANREYGDYYVSVNEGGECWTQSDVFKAELASGIDVLKYDNVKIYPNPSAGVFKTSLDNKISGELNVRVVNVLGSVVLSQINRTSDFDVDISSLTNGIYYISISYKDEVIIKKVVKQ